MDLKKFEEYLINKKVINKKTCLINNSKSDWPSLVEDFLNLVKYWLSNFEAKGLLKIVEENIDINKSCFNNGDSIKKLVVWIDGEDFISIEPIFKNRLTEFNHIEMVGKRGSISIVFELNNKWLFRKIIPLVEYEEVTQLSFLNAIYYLNKY